MIRALILHDTSGLLVIARHNRPANLHDVHIITGNVRLIMSGQKLLCLFTVKRYPFGRYYLVLTNQKLFKLS